jgi:hypothetical protein
MFLLIMVTTRVLLVMCYCFEDLPVTVKAKV